MKIQFALVAAAALVATAAAYEETQECPLTELAKLAPLASDENVAKCQNDSGWKMLPLASYPTDAESVLMCDSVPCFNLVNTVKGLNISDCLLVFNDVKLNVKKLVEQFEPSCYH